MKIAVISSKTSSLFTNRMDMMRDFIKNGHSVVALGDEIECKYKEMFEEIGIKYKHIFVDRTGINPFNDIKTYKDLSIFMKQEKPDKIFVYHAKTLVYGSVAAKLNGINEIYILVAGLGSIFRGNGFKNAIVKYVMTLQYKIAFKFSKKVFFHNQDDKNYFVKRGHIKEEKAIVINGSGVNFDIFKPEPLPNVPAFLFVGRLIKDKGIIEYLKACKYVKQKYPEVKCMLVGAYDINPSALQPEEIKKYIELGIVEYYGEQKDVRPYLKQCSTFVFPSYHEGCPKVVLEAMAVGRAIITTDAPGCRDVVIEGYNGYLIPVRDIDSLVEKMIFLINNKNTNSLMAKRSLELARAKYDVKLVNESIMSNMELL